MLLVTNIYTYIHVCSRCSSGKIGVRDILMFRILMFSKNLLLLLLLLLLSWDESM